MHLSRYFNLNILIYSLSLILYMSSQCTLVHCLSFKQHLSLHKSGLDICLQAFEQHIRATQQNSEFKTNKPAAQAAGADPSR